MDAEAISCTPGFGGSPEIRYTVGSNVALFPPPAALQFFDGPGNPVGSPVPVNAASGTVGHPFNPLDFGWSLVGEVWERDPSAPRLSVQVSAVIDGTTYESPRSMVRYDGIVNCVEVLPPPEGGSNPPPSNPGTLPRTGTDILDTVTRLGALLLIAGLGTVIVSRRRRFAVTPPHGPASAAS